MALEDVNNQRQIPKMGTDQINRQLGADYFAFDTRTLDSDPFLQAVERGEVSVPDSFETATDCRIADTVSEMRDEFAKPLSDDTFNKVLSPLDILRRINLLRARVIEELESRDMILPFNDQAKFDREFPELASFFDWLIELRAGSDNLTINLDSAVEETVRTFEAYYKSGQELPDYLAVPENIARMIPDLSGAALQYANGQKAGLLGYARNMQVIAETILNIEQDEYLLGFALDNNRYLSEWVSLAFDLERMLIDADGDVDKMERIKEAIGLVKEFSKGLSVAKKVDSAIFSTIWSLAYKLPHAAKWMHDLSAELPGLNDLSPENNERLAKSNSSMARMLSGLGSQITGGDYHFILQNHFPRFEGVLEHLNALSHFINDQQALDSNISGFSNPAGRDTFIRSLLTINPGLFESLFKMNEAITKTQIALEEKIEHSRETNDQAALSHSQNCLGALKVIKFDFKVMLGFYMDFTKNWLGTDKIPGIGHLCQVIKRGGSTLSDASKKVSEIAEIRTTDLFKNSDLAAVRAGICSLIQLLARKYFALNDEWPREDQVSQWINRFMGMCQGDQGVIRVLSEFRSSTGCFAVENNPQQAEADLNIIYENVVGLEVPGSVDKKRKRRQRLNEINSRNQFWLAMLGLADNKEVERIFRREVAGRKLHESQDLRKDLNELTEEVIVDNFDHFKKPIDSIAETVYPNLARQFHVTRLSNSDPVLIRELVNSVIDGFGFNSREAISEALIDRFEEYIYEMAPNYLSEYLANQKTVWANETPPAKVDETRSYSGTFNAITRESETLDEVYGEFETMETFDIEGYIHDGVVSIVNERFNPDITFAEAEDAYKTAHEWGMDIIRSSYSPENVEVMECDISHAVMSVAPELTALNLTQEQWRLVEMVQGRLKELGLQDGDIEEAVIREEVRNERVFVSDKLERHSSVRTIVEKLMNERGDVFEMRRKEKFDGLKDNLRDGVWRFVEENTKVTRGLIESHVGRIVEGIGVDRLVGLSDEHFETLCGRIAKKAIEMRREEVKEEFENDARECAEFYINKMDMEVTQLQLVSTEKLAQMVVEMGLEMNDDEGPADFWMKGWRREIFLREIERSRQEKIVIEIQEIREAAIDDFRDQTEHVVAGLLWRDLAVPELVDAMRMVAAQVTGVPVESRSELYENFSPEQRKILASTISKAIKKRANGNANGGNGGVAEIRPAQDNLDMGRATLKKPVVQPRALRPNYVQELDSKKDGVWGKIRSAGGWVKNLVSRA